MATLTATLPRTRRSKKSARNNSNQMSFPEFYYVKHIDNSRLKREVDPVRRRECYGLLGLGVLVFFFVLLFSWQHFQCVQFGYRIEQAKTQKASFEEWNHQLKLERASLADPQRIDYVARKQLGLVPPDPKQVIQVSSGDDLENSVLARNNIFLGAEKAGPSRRN
jgi:cell division protein FtsL